jgi:hypothetical protein
MRRFTSISFVIFAIVFDFFTNLSFAYSKEKLNGKVGKNLKADAGYLRIPIVNGYSEHDIPFPFEEAIAMSTSTPPKLVYHIPYCDSPVIFTNGIPDAEKTIYNCSNYAPAPYQSPAAL